MTALCGQSYVWPKGRAQKNKNTGHRPSWVTARQPGRQKLSLPAGVSLCGSHRSSGGISGEAHAHSHLTEPLDI